MKPLCHLSNEMPNSQACLVESIPGLVLGKAQEAPDSLVLVAFNIVQEKNQPFRQRQLHDSTLQVHSFHVGPKAADFGGGMLQGQTSDRHQMPNFRHKGLIDLLSSWKRYAGENAQKSVCRQLIRGKFVVCDPEGQ